MPRSKRNRLVSLTKVAKKGAAGKAKLVQDIQNALETFKHAFVFKVDNMRNNNFKEIREEFIGSRFFMGKNKVMKVALGRDKSEEKTPSSYKLGRMLQGNSVGILFTDKSPEEIIEYFTNYEAPNFARSGFTATETFELKEGVLEDQPFSIEPLLRKLGLSTKLVDGKVYLEKDTIICQEGDVLTSNQCKLLELFGVEMAVMRVLLLSHLDIESGSYEEYEHEGIEGYDGEEGEDDEGNDSDDMEAEESDD